MTIQLKQLVEIPVDGVHIEGVLNYPPMTASCCSRMQWQQPAQPAQQLCGLRASGAWYGTLLMDLLTLAEDLTTRPALTSHC